MPAWLFTNTFYGTWLPGDPRGSVTSVRERRHGDCTTSSRIKHDQAGTAYDGAMRGLQRSAASRLKGPPVRLDRDQSEVLLAQLIGTGEYRQWPLLAIAIMPDHLHWIVILPEETAADRALADFKAYSSRALNKRFGAPPGRWWTTKGSTRLLKDNVAIEAATRYVLEKQPNPLVTWCSSR